MNESRFDSRAVAGSVSCCVDIKNAGVIASKEIIVLGWRMIVLYM